MGTQATIRLVSYSEILGAPNAQQLIAEYAAECSIPEIGKTEPQAETYAKLEAAGLMACFGVYEPLGHPLDDPTLVGFAAVLTGVLPHYGRKVATVESLFVSQGRRAGGSGRFLLNAVEDHAVKAGCVAILYSAPWNSDFHFVLATRAPYCLTNAVYCRSLA